MSQSHVLLNKYCLHYQKQIYISKVISIILYLLKQSMNLIKFIQVYCKNLAFFIFLSALTPHQLLADSFCQDYQSKTDITPKYKNIDPTLCVQ